MVINKFISSIDSNLRGKRGLAIASGIATASLVTAFLLEKFGGFKPCALCWTQRGVFFAFILASIIGLIRFPVFKVGRTSYSIILALIAFFGAGIAIRHIYVIIKPPATSCGFGPDMIFEMLPFKDAIVQFLAGSPTCSTIDGILGIPFPVWSLMLFSIMALISLRLIKEKTR